MLHSTVIVLMQSSIIFKEKIARARLMKTVFHVTTYNVVEYFFLGSGKDQKKGEKF